MAISSLSVTVDLLHNSHSPSELFYINPKSHYIYALREHQTRTTMAVSIIVFVFMSMTSAYSCMYKIMLFDSQVENIIELVRLKSVTRLNDIYYHTEIRELRESRWNLINFKYL